jgi:prolipoprotein diacylglyceryltransferase
MTFPYFLNLGPWQVHPHLLFEVLAYLVGGQLFWFLRRHGGDPLDGPTRMSVMAGAVLGAGLGAKLLHALTLMPALSLVGWNAVLGGKSVLGALLGGHLGVELVKARIKESRRTGDLFVIPVVVGILLGRIGCFLTGLADGTYGGPTSLPWGVDFGDGIPRHTTQLYEVIVLLVFLFAALWLRSRLSRRGDLWRLFIAGYSVWRLGVDSLKPYPRILGLNAIQWTAMLALILLVWERAKEHQPVQQFGGNCDES